MNNDHTSSFIWNSLSPRSSRRRETWTIGRSAITSSSTRIFLRKGTCSRTSGSFCFADYLLQNWPPRFLLRLDEGGDFVRRHVAHEGAVCGELGSDLGVVERLVQIRTDLAHDRLGGA